MIAVPLFERREALAEVGDERVLVLDEVAHGRTRRTSTGPPCTDRANASARSLHLRTAPEHRPEFEHVLPAHGEPVIGGAKPAYRAAIEGAAALRVE